MFDLDRLHRYSWVTGRLNVSIPRLPAWHRRSRSPPWNDEPGPPPTHPRASLPLLPAPRHQAGFAPCGAGDEPPFARGTPASGTGSKYGLSKEKNILHLGDARWPALASAGGFFPAPAAGHPPAAAAIAACWPCWLQHHPALNGRRLVGKYQRQTWPRRGQSKTFTAFFIFFVFVFVFPSEKEMTTSG